jgi:hypothetical protein
MVPFHDRFRSSEGWAKFNAAYWLDHYEDFLRFFFAQVWTEPHSRSLIEDCVTWGLETTPQVLIDTVDAHGITEAEALALARRVRSPMLVIHGSADAVTPVERSVRLARETGGRLVILDAAGHCPGNRDPVSFNLLIRELLQALPGTPPSMARAAGPGGGGPRGLFVPTGGRAEVVGRDVAIAAAMRALRPDLQIEWLAPEPVRTALVARGESIHPKSGLLVGEEVRAGSGSDFEAWRRTDEALFANFMVFNELVGEEPIDLVVADDAWQVDYYLHRSPELKRVAYAWLADRVGWTPGVDAGERERALVADANAEMAALVERCPTVRDQAIWLGDLDLHDSGTVTSMAATLATLL